MSEKPKTSMESLDHLLKEVYQDQLNYQLNSTLFFLPREPPPPPLTRKQKFKRKWKRLWDHIPDFINFVKEYKYEEWRYWDKDGF